MRRAQNNKNKDDRAKSGTQQFKWCSNIVLQHLDPNGQADAAPSSLVRKGLNRLLVGNGEQVDSDSLVTLLDKAPGECSGRSVDLDGPLMSQDESSVTPVSLERSSGTADTGEAPGLSHTLFSEALGHSARYVVLGRLGRGGMGEVLEAFDRKLDRKVAVKLLHREVAEQQLQRLVREAKALAKLSHPNVVQVHDAGTIDGQAFVAMELVKGQTLRKWQAQRRPWRECVQVYLQVGRGLAAAHNAGLVHRDFKPDNCIIDPAGRVRVLDFGLVREMTAEERAAGGLLSSGSGESKLPSGLAGCTLQQPVTLAGTVVGTPVYMAPEQIKGQRVGVEADQFSFCIALFEAIYGERPFDGNTLEALAEAIANGKLRPEPVNCRVPVRLRRVLLRGLSPVPAERWPSMETMLAELVPIVEPRRFLWMVLASGLVGLLVGIVVGVLVR